MVHDVCKADEQRMTGENIRHGYLDDDLERSSRKSARYCTQVHGPVALTADCVEALKNKARLAQVSGKFWELKSLTRELFDFVSIEFEVDPEDDGAHFFIFNVKANGDISEISCRRREWNRHVLALLKENAPFARLLIDVK